MTEDEFHKLVYKAFELWETDVVSGNTMSEEELDQLTFSEKVTASYDGFFLYLEKAKEHYEIK